MSPTEIILWLQGGLLLFALCVFEAVRVALSK